MPDLLHNPFCYEFDLEPGCPGDTIQVKVTNWSPLRMEIMGAHSDMEQYRMLMGNKAMRNEQPEFNYNAGCLFDLQETVTSEALYELLWIQKERQRRVTRLSAVAMAAACLVAFVSMYAAAAGSVAVLAVYAFVLFRIYRPNMKAIDDLFAYHEDTYGERRSRFLQRAWRHARGRLRLERQRANAAEQIAFEWYGEVRMRTRERREPWVFSTGISGASTTIQSIRQPWWRAFLNRLTMQA